MLNKVFLESLVTFLHLTLKEKSITKTKLNKLINIFTKMWVSELRKSKKNAKNKIQEKK